MHVKKDKDFLFQELLYLSWGYMTTGGLSLNLKVNLLFTKDRKQERGTKTAKRNLTWGVGLFEKKDACSQVTRQVSHNLHVNKLPFLTKDSKMQKKKHWMLVDSSKPQRSMKGCSLWSEEAWLRFGWVSYNLLLPSKAIFTEYTEHFLSETCLHQLYLISLIVRPCIWSQRLCWSSL